MNEIEYIGTADGGIPKKTFTYDPENNRRDIEVGSGKRFIGLIDKNDVAIYDPDGFEIFTARARPYKDGNKVSLYIVNKSANERGKDIWPSRLLDESIRYLEKNVGEITHIEGLWSDAPGIDDEYKSYQNYISKLGKSAFSIQDKETAVKSTWTGRYAISHGFTEVESVEEIHTKTGNSMSVLFAKPSK